MKIFNENRPFFMGNVFSKNQEMDIRQKVAGKKRFYEKEAMHIVNNTRKGEQKIDKSIETIKDQIRMLEEENEEANSFLRDIKAKMAQAKEEYGVEDGSIEEQELQLRQKIYDAKTDPSIKITEEEMQRYLELGEPSDYQKVSMELYKQAGEWEEKMADIKNKLAGNNSVIRDVKIERLKSHAMVDAMKAKEELLEAASKEAVRALLEESKEKIDEKAEEIQETAEKREEKKEEEKERIEAAREDKTEAEAVAENNRKNARNLTEQAVKSEDIVRDIQSEVQKILEEEKLLEEELKGLTVNIEV